MSATTAKTITVTDAATQLGLSESDFRALLKGIYKNPTTIKKISFDNFKMLAETLKQRATENSEPQIEELEPQIEPEIESEVEIENSIIDTNTQPIDDEIEEKVEESISLATTDSQALDIPQDRAKMQLNINLNLSNQVLDLNKISSALAIVAGEQAVKNFEEIYTHTFNTGVDRVLENFAHRTYDTIQQLREVDNSDFLKVNGRDTNILDTQAAISLVSQFL